MTTDLSAPDVDFCIHCGVVDERTADRCWLCEDHWKLAVRVWGRTDAGDVTCPLCELADAESSVVDGDTDQHLLEEHGVETNFEFIRERERLLGVPSPEKRDVQISPADRYPDNEPQSSLAAFADGGTTR